MTSLAEGLDLYVVSLSHRLDRRSWMSAQAEKIGLPIRFFDAVNGAETAPEDFAQRFDNHGPLGEFGAGDMACTLSHLQICEQFLESTSTHCVVLEDDALMAADLPDWLSDLSWFPRDADIVKLEAGTQKGLVVLLGRTKQSHLGRDLRPLLSRHTGAAGYIINRNAARKILGHLLHIDMPIDHFLFNQNISPIAADLGIYQIEPALVQQDEAAGVSDLHALRKTDMPKSDRWLRDVRRGWAEVSRLPQQVLAMLIKGARLVKIEWVSQAKRK